MLRGWVLFEGGMPLGHLRLRSVSRTGQETPSLHPGVQSYLLFYKTYCSISKFAFSWNDLDSVMVSYIFICILDSCRSINTFCTFLMGLTDLIYCKYINIWFNPWCKYFDLSKEILSYMKSIITKLVKFVQLSFSAIIFISQRKLHYKWQFIVKAGENNLIFV